MRALYRSARRSIEREKRLCDDSRRSFDRRGSGAATARRRDHGEALDHQWFTARYTSSQPWQAAGVPDQTIHAGCHPQTRVMGKLHRVSSTIHPVEQGWAMSHFFLTPPGYLRENPSDLAPPDDPRQCSTEAFHRWL